MTLLMKKFSHLLISLLLLSLLLPLAVLAQDSGLSLSLNRDFGYGGFAGDIQGTFSFRAEGPQDLVTVRFYIDDQLVGEDSEAPYRLQFQTDNYDLGRHELYAVGQTASGAELRSNVITREFVPQSQGWATAGRIVVPILILALGIPVFMYILDRRRRGGRGGYGPWGAAVCPKCGKPFGRHLWAPNVGLGKFDRCPHCGKWSVVRVAPPAMVQAAEALLDDGGEAPAGPEPALTPEEKLRRRLEDSKYD